MFGGLTREGEGGRRVEEEKPQRWSRSQPMKQDTVEACKRWSRVVAVAGHEGE